MPYVARQGLGLDSSGDESYVEVWQDDLAQEHHAIDIVQTGKFKDGSVTLNMYQARSLRDALNVLFAEK